MKHPYEEYEASRLWEFVKSSIEDLVENNEEQEVLFSRNCRFHILSAKIENKVIVLEMEEV